MGLLDYELLDSGDGKKLERIGGKTVVRPSAVALWKPRQAAAIWQSADAQFDPHSGWQSKPSVAKEWDVKLASFRMRLRLQSNGQVGVFPEHQNYLGPLLGVLEELSAGRQGPIRVLNLFAYTGMASLLCRGAGAEVCHVDLSKRSIEWVRQNLECNGLSDGVRLIREDAAKFLQREVRRESKYDVIIADPPSFSRVSKAKHWTIEDVLPGLISSCRGCLESEKGLFVLTSHSTFPLEVYYNLVTDIFTDHDFTTIGRSLSLREQGVQRALPSGYLVASGCGIGCMSAFAT